MLMKQRELNLQKIYSYIITPSPTTHFLDRWLKSNNQSAVLSKHFFNKTDIALTVSYNRKKSGRKLHLLGKTNKYFFSKSRYSLTFCRIKFRLFFWFEQDKFGSAELVHLLVVRSLRRRRTDNIGIKRQF